MAPPTVEELKEHRLIASEPTREGEAPHSDLEWILKLGLPKGKKHKPIFSSNLLENLIDAAQKGVGIVSGYDLLSIFRKSGLQHIMKDAKKKGEPYYIIYPEHLKKGSGNEIFYRLSSRKGSEKNNIN